MNQSDHKAVIVTGSSRGIGRAIPLRLASDGYAVIVQYAGKQKAADDVVGQIAALAAGA